MKTKQKTSVSLTEEALRLLSKLADSMGISRSAMLEIVIRDKAEREKVK